MRSTGMRFFVVGLLALLMFIPLFFAGEIVDSRARYARESLRSVSSEWGGPQTISGPQLVIPVEGPVEVEKQREIRGDDGEVRTETYSEIEIRRRQSLVLLPENFAVDFSTVSEIRKRGLFEVPVYRANSRLSFDFSVDGLDANVDDQDTILWQLARLEVGLTSNRALRGAAILSVDGHDVPLRPRLSSSGVMAAVGDPQEALTYELVLEFNGARSLYVAPVGWSNTITMSSDWPHPSFSGAFLPDSSEISEAGFHAQWTIPGLARPLPQVSRSDQIDNAAQRSFGVRFYQPNDFYQQAYRAARYGLLFISLTFLTVLLIEKRQARPAHPVQYILIGLAQSTFVLLMVAYAEQIGFGAAYLLSAAVTTALITFYAFVGLKLGNRAWIMGALLVVLYAVLYLILRSADYALMFGATLAFMAIAATMIATKDEEWYGVEGKKARPWMRAKTAQPLPHTEVPDDST
ncbi:cell envelope integrity protein CreD [Yoonia sp. I 8.24]|uniref:cell envelope integrity protein CreD n=1 Tax=Yoonia sp. I 8.24 TaxID=1537229 RepID=UPI001EDECF11|nr:cell envelope integrity protein CreD [Yoonia sp. I 8.24]MCG3266757.1 cell envelope integrity protein CreD [Yoonia sp. I 8.24]